MCSHFVWSLRHSLAWIEITKVWNIFSVCERISLRDHNFSGDIFVAIASLKNANFLFRHGNTETFLSTRPYRISLWKTLICNSILLDDAKLLP